MGWRRYSYLCHPGDRLCGHILVGPEERRSVSTSVLQQQDSALTATHTDPGQFAQDFLWVLKHAQGKCVHDL